MFAIIYLIVVIGVFIWSQHLFTFKSDFAKKCQRMYNDLPHLIYIEGVTDDREIRGYKKDNPSIFPDFSINLDDGSCKIYNHWNMEFIWGTRDGFLGYVPQQWYWRNKFRKWFKENLHKIETVPFKEHFKNKANER